MTSTLRENGVRPGVYNVDYFSGAQVALYIGDVWVDEVTSIAYNINQSRTPLYGYADQLFRDVSKGQVIVSGQFSINFKEAGYLWLVLNRFQTKHNGAPSLIGNRINPWINSGTAEDNNIERLINGELSVADRMKLMEDLSKHQNDIIKKLNTASKIGSYDERRTSSLLGGFSSIERSGGGIGEAENAFERFEDQIWKEKDPAKIDREDRRADDPDLNPFDIYLAYGDYAGDNTANHTIRKITGVNIVGTSQQIVIDGQPIQEVYSFIARNVI